MIKGLSTFMYLRYDGWCICMGLSGRFLGSEESPNCHISNERHLHSCFKLLSDIRIVYALQVSQWGCVSTTRMVDFHEIELVRNALSYVVTS
jgi:hypothetical protein